MIEKIALTLPGPGGSVRISAPGGIPTAGYFSWNFPRIIETGLTLLIIASVILALFFLIWGGLSWITSEGDKQKLAAARQKITYSIIVLLIVFLSFFIVNFLFRFFNVGSAT